MNIISSVSQSLAPLKDFINNHGGEDVKNAFKAFTDAAKELGGSTLDLTKNIGSKIRDVTVSAFEATTVGRKISGAISYAKLPEEDRRYIESIEAQKKTLEALDPKIFDEKIANDIKTVLEKLQFQAKILSHGVRNIGARSALEKLEGLLNNAPEKPESIKTIMEKLRVVAESFPGYRPLDPKENQSKKEQS